MFPSFFFFFSNNPQTTPRGKYHYYLHLHKKGKFKKFKGTQTVQNLDFIINVISYTTTMSTSLWSLCSVDWRWFFSLQVCCLSVLGRENGQPAGLRCATHWSHKVTWNMSVLFLSTVHCMLSQTSYLSFLNISFPFYKKGLLICLHKVDLGNKQVSVPR